MSVLTPTNFNVQAQIHIDTRLTQADITARDDIATPIRYWGMQVHVLDSDGGNNPNTYILQKGTTSINIFDNGNWIEIQSGGVGWLLTGASTLNYPATGATSFTAVDGITNQLDLSGQDTAETYDFITQDILTTGRLSSGAANFLRFQTNGLEKLRMASSGELFVNQAPTTSINTINVPSGGSIGNSNVANSRILFDGTFTRVYGAGIELRPAGVRNVSLNTTDFIVYQTDGDNALLQVEIDTRNVSLLGNSPVTYGTSSNGVLYVNNATVIPAGDPTTGGGVMYATANNLYWRGNGGGGAIQLDSTGGGWALTGTTDLTGSVIIDTNAISRTVQYHQNGVQALQLDDTDFIVYETTLGKEAARFERDNVILKLGDPTTNNGTATWREIRAVGSTANVHIRLRGTDSGGVWAWNYIAAESPLGYGEGFLDQNSVSQSISNVLGASNFSIYASRGIATRTKGNDLRLYAGLAYATGNDGGNTLIKGGNGIDAGADGNIALGTTSVTAFQAMENGIFIADVITAPTGNPTAGGFLYVSGTSLNYRDDVGTITDLTAGGGGSSAGINDEVQTSDGAGGFIASQLFVAEATANVTIGGASLAGASRDLIVGGSAADVHFYIKGKGSGDLGFYSDGLALFLSGATGSSLLELSPGAGSQTNLTIFSGSASAAANAGDLTLHGGNSVNGIAGDLILRGGEETSAGTHGDVIIQQGAVEAARFVDEGIKLSGDATQVIKTVHLQLTTAQVKALATTPIIIVPAQGAGFHMQVIGASAKLSYATATYTGGSFIFLTGSGNASTLASTSAGFITNASDLFVQMYMPATAQAFLNNNSLEIEANADSTVGDSPIDVWVQYVVIDTN